jgi:uncharacterized membrane protein
MRQSFSTAIDIAAPPAQVWAIMRAIERWHEWTASIRSVERLDGGPIRTGSRARVRQPRLPAAVWEVTDWVEDKGFTWVSRAPGVRVTGDHQVAPHGSGTRATLAIHYEGPLAPILVWFTRAVNDRYLALEAAGLKKRSEEQYLSTPGGG